MNQYKIIVNQNELDTYEDDIISLNYQIDDILDVTKRSTNYSKTITLPGTPFNNKFFKQIFDVNIDNITFNPLIKLPAIITIGDNTVMNGSLQLLNIVINQRNVEYEVVITGLLRNILLDITELSLRDIDLSEYNHIRTQDNIVNSWTYNIKNWGVDTQYGGPGTGYVYPYIINGNSSSIWNTLLIYDATPAVYVKTIMEKIFETAGYTYTSNFFDSQYYNKLIIPFTDEKIQVDDEELLLRDVIVGVSGATSGPIEGYVSMTSSEILRGTPWYYNQPYSYDIPLLRESGQVGDIIFKDPSGQWGQYGGFTCQNQGFYDIDLNLKMVARYREGNGVYQFKWTGNGFFKYYYRVQVLRNDGTVQTLSTSTVPLEWQPSDEVDGPGFVGPSFIDITNPLEFSANIQNVFLSEGEQVVIFFAVRYPEDGMTWNIDGFGGDDVRLSMLLAESLGGEPSSLKITPSSNQDMGLQMINMNQILPDIKMKDFFLNIVKMFNLLILDNPDKENDLIIEPKDEFFKSKQKIRDWTLKLDNDSDVKITPMSELDAKLYYYKYTKDNDYYNEEYFDDTKREYGELKLYVENDFSDTTNKMELIFAPTPNAQEGIDSRVAPSFISKTDGVMKPKKVKPRILFYGGVKDLYTGSELYIKDNELQDEIDYTTSVVYPYCGMWDDPFSPQYDLGFDETDKIYWDTDIRPFYNLYEQFHATTFNAISDVNSRLMEGKFYLTPQDIASFDFRDIILIDNSYWRVVKIKNYNPVNSDKLTDVVLFKINDLNVFAPDQYQVPVSNGSCPTDMIRKRTLNGWVNISSSGQIVTEDCCNQVNGTWVQGVCYAYGVVGNPIDFNNGDTIKPNKLTRSNISPISQKNGSTTSNKNNNTSLSTDVVLQGLLNYVDGGVKNSTIVGDKNYISPNVNNSMIVGDNNSMVPSSENITIFGNNNIVQNEELTGTTTNVFIVGNNITATTSNTLYTDNIQMSSGSTINGVPVSGITNPTLSQVLTNGNTTGANWIDVDSGYGLQGIDIPSTITDTISIDPSGAATGIKSENITTGEKSYSTYNPSYYETVLDSISINDRRDFITLDTQGYGNETGIKSENILTTNLTGILFNPDNSSMYASDNVNTIYDTISLDPQLLGNGTGIKSENTTTGIYSQTTHTPTDIILASVDGAGETSQITIANGAGQGVEIQTGDVNNYSTINITSLYTTLSLNDIPNNQVDALVLDTGNTGITSEDTLSGNISSSIYTPNGITSQANDVASTITDTITLDPQGLGNGTGIKSENTTTNELGLMYFTPNDIGLQVIDYTSLNNASMGMTNLYTVFSQVNNTIPSIDTFSLDPTNALGNKTGLYSSNTTIPSDNSSITITPVDITTTVTDGLNSNTLLNQSYNYNRMVTDTTDDTIIDMNKDIIGISQTNNTNDVISEIVLDGAFLGSVNGTFIETRKISTSDLSRTQYTEFAIANTVTDGTDTSTLNITKDDITLNPSNGIFLSTIGSATPIMNLGLSSTGQVVTGTTGGVTEDLATTLAAGNTTGTNDIVISTTQKIDSYGGLSSIEMDKLGTEGVFAIATNVTGDYSQLTLNQSSADATIEAANISGDYSNHIFTPVYQEMKVFDGVTSEQTIINIQPLQYQIGVYGTSLSTSFLQSDGAIQLFADDTTSSYLQLNKRIIKSSDIQTNDATPVNIITIPTIGNGMLSIKASIVGLKTDYTKGYGSELYGVFKNNGGTVTQIGTTDLIEKSNFTTATSTIDFSGTNIRVRVTGEALTDINWSVQIEIINSL